MKNLTYANFPDGMGDPEPALLVDREGNAAGFQGIEHSQPHTWAVSAFVPGNTFADYLLNYEPPNAAVNVAPSIVGVSALVIVLQMDAWQHRVVVPLIGQTIYAHLLALRSCGMPLSLELHANGMTTAQGFDVQVTEEMLSRALEVHLMQPKLAELEMYRRAMGAHCFNVRKPDAVPGHPAAKPVRTITVGRVWPPELPFQGPGGMTTLTAAE